MRNNRNLNSVNSSHDKRSKSRSLLSHSDSHDKIPTHFVLGPPAAGKTTLSKIVATQNKIIFRTIDQWVHLVYPSELKNQPMTDVMVDDALMHLMSSLAGYSELVEFSHHDYIKLFDAYPIFTSSPKIIVTAPLKVCLERNNLRRNPVPPRYVERAWMATERLTSQLLLSGQMLTIIDTSSHSLQDSVIHLNSSIYP